MTNAYLVWQSVSKRSPPGRRAELPKLQKFLATLDNNPHACVLSGRTPNGLCNEESARALEAWVVSLLLEDPPSEGKARFTKVRLAEWLRLILDAINAFNRAGEVLSLTNLADAIRPPSNPFSPIAMGNQRRVDTWRQQLYLWLERDEKNWGSDESLAAIVLSAAIHGALLDSRKLTMLFEMLREKKEPSSANGLCYYQFDLPYQGLGNHNLHRWFLDPITEMMVWQFLTHYRPSEPNDTSLKNVLDAFFLQSTLHEHFYPHNVRDFLDSLTSWWSTRASPIDLHCVARSLSSHAINERSWTRLGNQAWDGATAIEQESRMRTSASTPEEDAEADILLLYPWLSEAIDALSANDASEIQALIQDLKLREHPDSVALEYLDWLLHMLKGMSASGSALAVFTIRQRFATTAPKLIGSIGPLAPSTLSTDVLEDHYFELLTDADPLAPLKTLAEGLRDFHAYMHKVHGKALLTSEAKVFGDDNALKPVDATVITFDEYEKTQRSLDKIRGNRREVLQAKIVLMLGFRLGLRRMEIFGLRRQDIQWSRYSTCIVRVNSLRRLKSDNSKRVVPLLPFLTSKEQELLRSMTEPGSDYFFPEFSGEDSQAWRARVSKLVVDTLRKVTKDSSLVLHHLRHSFATWTYLRLRAADLPSIARHFKHLPATYFALRTGRRLRVLLYGRDPGVSRTYPFAVCRLLGHSSPVVSFGHYVHSSDLVMAAITQRECARLDSMVWLKASGLRKTAAYKHLAESTEHLLEASRAMYMKPYLASIAPAPKKAKRGRPDLPPPHARQQWIPLRVIEQVLHLTLVERVPPHEVAHETGIGEDRIESMCARATAFGARLGLLGPDGTLNAVPLKTHRKLGTDYCRVMEERLADMSIRAPMLYAQGISIYLQHYDPEKKDVVFKGAKNLPQLKTLLRFLSSLGADPAEFAFVRRSADPNVESPPDWATKLSIDWLPAKFKRIHPKNSAGAASYGEWLGILPLDADDRSLGLPVTKTMFLASLGLD